MSQRVLSHVITFCMYLLENINRFYNLPTMDMFTLKITRFLSFDCHVIRKPQVIKPSTLRSLSITTSFTRSRTCVGNLEFALEISHSRRLLAFRHIGDQDRSVALTLNQTFSERYHTTRRRVFSRHSHPSVVHVK